MSSQCLPPHFGSIRLNVREQTSFEGFQDGYCGGHLGYQNGTFLEILNLYVAPMPPLSFSSIPLTVWEVISFEDFQDGRHGGHLGYWNRMILAIPTLHVAPMPPNKFGLNLT